MKPFRRQAARRREQLFKKRAPVDTLSTEARSPISPASPAKGDGAESDTPNNTSEKDEGAK